MNATDLINDAFACNLTIAESMNGIVVVYGAAVDILRWHLVCGLVAVNGALVDANGSQLGMINGDHAAIVAA